MKLPCKVIEDMLPMYYDGVCSTDSVQLIEEHLKECPQCSSILAQLRSNNDIPESKLDDVKPLIKIQKRMKTNRRRWLIGIAAIVALIPIAFLVGNAYNQLRKQAAEYSEEEAIADANAFMSTLVEGDYEKAFSYWDIESKKHEWLNGPDFQEEDLVNLEKDGLNKFCELGRSKVEALGGLESYEYVSTNDCGYDYRGYRQYGVHYTVRFAGKDELFYVRVSEEGVSTIGAADGYLKHPLVEFCIWGHWLYDDYMGRYYDHDLKEYVYYDKG